MQRPNMAATKHDSFAAFCLVAAVVVAMGVSTIRCRLKSGENARSSNRAASAAQASSSPRPPRDADLAAASSAHNCGTDEARNADTHLAHETICQRSSGDDARCDHETATVNSETLSSPLRDAGLAVTANSTEAGMGETNIVAATSDEVSDTAPNAATKAIRTNPNTATPELVQPLVNSLQTRVRDSKTLAARSEAHAGAHLPGRRALNRRVAIDASPCARALPVSAHVNLHKWDVRSTGYSQ